MIDELTLPSWTDLTDGAVLQADAIEGQPPFWYRPPMFLQHPQTERATFDRRERELPYDARVPWWTTYERNHDGPINPVAEWPKWNSEGRRVE